jgi:uncharacterized protein
MAVRLNAHARTRISETTLYFCYGIYCTHLPVNNTHRLECNVTPKDFAYLSEKAGETFLCAYIQPRASRSEFSGIFRERLKIRISSPPVEGEANRQCIDFLAKTIGVSKSEIKLVKGGKSREKTFVISRPIGFVREKLNEADPDRV